MRAAFLCCTFALVLAGCSIFGDRFGSGRAVSLIFPPSASLSASSSEVQDALRITDAVLLPEGLTRTTPSSVPDANSMIAYYHYTPERPRSCEVFLTGSRLNIVFAERYERHSSGDVKGMCADLAKKFRGHYDPKIVRVED